jgi:hypothetical protein
MYIVLYNTLELFDTRDVSEFLFTESDDQFPLPEKHTTCGGRLQISVLSPVPRRTLPTCVTHSRNHGRRFCRYWMLKTVQDYMSRLPILKKPHGSTNSLLVMWILQQATTRRSQNKRNHNMRDHAMGLVAKILGH